MRAYYNTICSLGFAPGKGENRITYKNFDNHFVLVFNLTSSREASKNLTLFPELTRGSLTLKVIFEQQLERINELFLIAEKFSQAFITSERTVLKNTVL